MFGALTIDVSFSAFLLLIALWLIARHEADLDWSKLLMVSAGTGLLSIVPPLYLWSSLLERFQWDLGQIWPIVLLGTLAWQIGVFTVMLNRFVWVSIPKALLAWVIIQTLVIVKDGVFAVIRGQSLVDSAWTSVTGMESPAQRREAERRAEEAEQRMQALRKAMEEGDLATLAGETNTSAEAATVAPPAVVIPPAPVATQAVALAQAPPPLAPAPATVVPVAASVASAPPAVAQDPDREASRKLLVVNGRTQQKGRVILLVNGHAVEVGDTVTVTFNGRRFHWRLAGFDKNQPRWE
jgi:hypothetical protein